MTCNWARSKRRGLARGTRAFGHLGIHTQFSPYMRTSRMHLCMFVCERACTTSRVNKPYLTYAYAMSRIDTVTPWSWCAPQGSDQSPCRWCILGILFFPIFSEIGRLRSDRERSDASHSNLARSDVCGCPISRYPRKLKSEIFHEC